MDLSKIRELLQIVAESGVAEVELEEDDFKLVVRKNAPAVMMQQPMMPPMMMPQGYGMSQGYGMPPQGFGQQSYGMPQGYAPPPPAPTPAPAAAPPAPVGTSPKEAAPAEPELSANDVEVPAPIVGTFYRASSPDSEPFVKEGDQVQPGDVLCIIEAMKLMNEIECEVSGTIKKILVRNAEPVEFDQPLFIVEKA